jgi:hypothetical protein
MNTLNQFDLFFIRNRLPRDVRDLLIAYGESAVTADLTLPAKLFLAGGFIRSVIAKEEINDVDLFASNKVVAHGVANELADKFKSRVYSTDNAYTVRAKPFTLQVIHRWTFPSPEECVKSFDYTIARAAVWASASVDAHGNTSHTWASACDPSYYEDLAARRLVYRSPVREEAAGGSLLRLLKFYRRGYTAPLDTIAAVMSRMAVKIDHKAILAGAVSNGTSEEKQIEKVLLGLLHEVDPNSVTNDPAYLTLKEETDEHAA